MFVMTILAFVCTYITASQTYTIRKVQCTDREMEVFIDKTFIRGLHKRYVTLTDPSCVHVVTLERLKVTIPLHSCGTAKNYVRGGVLYETILMTSYRLHDKREETIATVSCFYKQRYSEMSTSATNSLYQISMFSYHSMVKSKRPRLTINISLQSDDRKLQMSINNCIATPTTSTSLNDINTEEYIFLNKRWAVNSIVTKRRLPTENYFSIKYPQYLSNSRIACNVIVTNPYPRHRRRKRDTTAPEVHTDFLDIPVQQTQTRKLAQKRIKKSEHSKIIKHHHRKTSTQAGPETTNAVMAAGFALLGVVLVMITLALTIIFKSDEEERPQRHDSEAWESLLDDDDD